MDSGSQNRLLISKKIHQAIKNRGLVEQECPSVGIENAAVAGP